MLKIRDIFFHHKLLLSSEIFSTKNVSNEDKYRNFVHAYIGFATENPSLYELMFGRVIWKENNSTEALKNIELLH